MKIAVSASGTDLTSPVDPRFGRAAYFVLVESETGEAEAHDNAQNLNAVQGAGIQAGQTVARLGAKVLITGNVGPKAFSVLQQAGIEVLLAGEGTVEEAVAKWKAGSLESCSAPSKPGHWM